MEIQCWRKELMNTIECLPPALVLQQRANSNHPPSGLKLHLGLWIFFLSIPWLKHILI